MNTKEIDNEALSRKKEIDEDYELTRDTYRTLLESNKILIPVLKEICEGSEHPRAFEVFSKLTKDTADIADKLLDMQRKKQVVDTETVMEMLRVRDELENSKQPLLEARVVSERKFIGTTEDMQKRIAERIESEKNKE